MTVLSLLDDICEQTVFRSQVDFLSFDNVQPDLYFITIRITSVNLTVLCAAAVEHGTQYMLVSVDVYLLNIQYVLIMLCKLTVIAFPQMPA